MNLKAIIPYGQAEITVNGLHQWDYGRKLEIHSLDMQTLAEVEVHFACVGMEEAVVRSCSVTDGVAIAAIPDKCLEQTTPITAWVYEIADTTGFTTKQITLPIIARTRPSAAEEIPVKISDKYTEAVTAMNEAVDRLKKFNWLSLNDLFGVEKFLPSNTESPEIALTPEVRARYFPAGKLIAFKCKLYMEGNSEPFGTFAGTFFTLSVAPSMTTLNASPNLALRFEEDKVTIDVYDDSYAGLNFQYTIEIAVME